MLRGLKVKNFKIHKEVEIIFDGALSMLTGENHSGKFLLEASMVFSEYYKRHYEEFSESLTKQRKQGICSLGNMTLRFRLYWQQLSKLQIHCI